MGLSSRVAGGRLRDIRRHVPIDHRIARLRAERLIQRHPIHNFLLYLQVSQLVHHISWFAGASLLPRKALVRDHLQRAPDQIIFQRYDVSNRMLSLAKN